MHVLLYDGLSLLLKNLLLMLFNVDPYHFF